MYLSIKGLSSNKVFAKIDVSSIDLNQDLLTLLRFNEIPIASSCRGEMICKKCKINGVILACSITVKEFIERYGYIIEVDYL